MDGGPIEHKDWRKLIEITASSSPCDSAFIGIASCAMEQTPDDDWLEENDTVAWAAHPSSVLAFINAVAVQDQYVTFQGHFLEHVVAEIGKTDRVTEVLVRTGRSHIGGEDFGDLAHALSFDEHFVAHKLRTNCEVVVRRRRFRGRVLAKRLVRRVINHSGS